MMDFFVKDITYEMRELLIHSSQIERELLRKQSVELYDKLANYALAIKDRIIYCPEFLGLQIRLAQQFQFPPHHCQRDEDSKLAVFFDSEDFVNSAFIQVDTNEIYKIQREVMNYLSKQFLFNPCEDNPQFAYLLIRHKAERRIDESYLVSITEKLKFVSRSFVEYLSENKPPKWNWEEDIYVISRYLFDIVVEYTYKTANYLDTSDMKFNILDSFCYRDMDIPLWLNRRLDESVMVLQGILYDTIDFIMKNNYHSRHYQAWIRPIFFIVGINAVWFTLEQRSKEYE